jgi:hypothetical protein
MATKKVNHEVLDDVYLEIKGISFDLTRYLPAENGKPLGLLNEKITQGAKTRLRKILPAIELHLKAHQETKVSLPEGELLTDEEFDFGYEPLSLESSNVENIITVQDYSLTLGLLFE